MEQPHLHEQERNIGFVETMKAILLIVGLFLLGLKPELGGMAYLFIAIATVLQIIRAMGFWQYWSGIETKKTKQAEEELNR